MIRWHSLDRYDLTESLETEGVNWINIGREEEEGTCNVQFEGFKSFADKKNPKEEQFCLLIMKDGSLAAGRWNKWRHETGGSFIYSSALSSHGWDEVWAWTPLSVDEFFAMDGAEIEYAGFVVCDTYPTDLAENDWQGVARAGAGNKLIVFSYTVTNQTGEDLTVDMASHRARFNFRVKSDAGDVSKSALTTMLLSDMTIFRETLTAGESKTAVLIVEVTQDIASSLSGITMIMREGEARGELTLL